MLRGYFVGLCQLLRHSGAPPLAAAELAVRVLDQARQVARMYRQHVRLLRQLASAEGEPQEVLDLLDAELRDPRLRGQMVAGIDLEELLSPEAWDQCGPFLIPLWSAVLILIAITVDGWECALLGVRSTDPDRLAGFHPDSEVYR